MVPFQRSICEDVLIRCSKNFYIWFEIFNHKSNSNEDIHLAHIEPLITSVDPLTDHRATIVFQPMARASPASTKTNRRPDDQLGALEWWLWPQCVPGGCPLWKITYGQISGLMYFALWLSSSSKNLKEQSTFWYPLNVHCTLLFLGKKHIFIQGLASLFLKEVKSQV